ncbi:MAG: hypothetical protein WAS21_26805 [Geminicoccaceae bacterium]
MAADPVAAPEAFTPPKWCFGLGGSKTYTVTLPKKNTKYVFRVVPDRAGFNVFMRFNYPPNINFVVNQFGPGKAEAGYIIPGFNNRSGRVTVGGVGGSFGCFKLTVKP